MSGATGNDQRKHIFSHIFLDVLFEHAHLIYPSSFSSGRNWRKYEEYENMVDDGSLLDEEDTRNGSCNSVTIVLCDFFATEMIFFTGVRVPDRTR